MMLRVEKLRAQMKKDQLDGFLVTSPYNLRYLTNFTGTTGLAVITLDKAFFVTDFRYTEQAAAQAQGFEIVKNVGPIFDEVAKICQQEEINALAFEESYVSFAEYSVLEEIIEETPLVPVSGMIENLREVKDDAEIAIIEKACAIADQGYEHVLKMIKPGMTEIEVANQLDFFMRSLGATSVSFDTIVASGLRSAMPHGVASDKVIEQGDLITLDFGCYYDGYVSDHITAAGYGEAFGHSTGHGIGLEIHEGPNVSFRADKQFVVGNVITDEPGIYLPGIGGVRIEDDLLITPEGNRVLTSATKELIIL